MPGSGNAFKRLDAFYSERSAGAVDGPSAFMAPPSPAEERLAALALYRAASAEPVAAGFAADDTAGARNWTPLGPFAVVRGQGGTLPTVSGRVHDVAISEDGLRVYVATANGGVWRSLDAGRTWEPMSDGLEVLEPGGPVPAAGITRQADSLACGAIALVERPGRPDRLYVGTGQWGITTDNTPESGYLGVGVLRSDDGGLTWVTEEADVPLAGQGVYAVAFDPANPDDAVAATSNGLYRRTDQGAPDHAWKWIQQQYAPMGVPPVPGGPMFSCTSVVMGPSGAFYAVENGGTCWQSPPAAPGSSQPWISLPSIPWGSTDIGRVSIACSASAPVQLYALSARLQSPGRFFFHSLQRLDLGAATPTWRTVSDPSGKLRGLFGTAGGDAWGQGSYDQAIAVAPDDPDTVYVGGSAAEVPRQGGPAGTTEWAAALYRCKVRATATAFTCTSTLIGDAVHSDVHRARFRPGSSRELWVGCDGGIYVAADSTASGRLLFEDRNTGLSTAMLMGLDHIPGDESYAFCGAQDNGGLRWRGGDVWDHQMYGDGGTTVVNHDTPVSAHPNAAHPPKPPDREVLSGYTNKEVRRFAVNGQRYIRSLGNPPASDTLFYPPMASSPVAGQGSFVVFGGQKPYVSSDFTRTWNSSLAALPAHSGLIRAVAVHSRDLFYVGTTRGRVFRYQRAGTTWGAPTEFARDDAPATPETRPITGICIDPSKADGSAFYVTVGGVSTPAAFASHVFQVDTSRATRWAPRSTGLLPIQHNALLVDPGDATHLFTAADLGVWESTDSGASWRPLEKNLPDVAVVDLDFVTAGPVRLLRATTHGRGVFELRLDRPQPGIELYIRANGMDRRYGSARTDVGPLTDGNPSTLDESPDIYVEPQQVNGLFTLRGDVAPNVTDLFNLRPQPEVLATDDSNAEAITRVHVVVRNRGWRRADNVRVSLLVGPATDALPGWVAGYAAGSDPGTTDTWKAVGTTTLSGLINNRPGVATFALSSALLPRLSTIANKNYRLVALLHHDADRFADVATAAGSDLTQAVTLTTTSRLVAVRKVTVIDGAGRAAPAGGTGLFAPLATTVLAHRRLVDLADKLQIKVGTAHATVHPVERRVLAMARVTQQRLETGPQRTAIAGVPAVSNRLSGFAVLGSLGFEIPRYLGAFTPGGAWFSDTIRHGTADPHMSLVAVNATEIPFRLAQLAKTLPAKDAVDAFGLGLLSGAAANVVLSPQLTGLFAQETNADWSPFAPSRGMRALEYQLRSRYLGGPTAPLTPWLPAPGQLPADAWQPFVTSVTALAGFPSHLVPGFGPFERDLAGPPPAATSSGFADSYALLHDDTRIANWGFWPWLGLMLPIFTMPTVAFAAARALPHGKAFIQGGPLGEREVFEALALSMGLGSLTPFVYSMIMWSKVPDRTEAFTTALVMGLARLGVTTAALATSGDEGQSPAVRWAGLFPPLIGADAYAAIRALADSGRLPGVSKVFGLQTLPSLTALTTLGLLGIGRAITGSEPATPDDQTGRDVAYGLITGISGALGIVGASLSAMALSNGAGWHSWFGSGTSPSLLDAAAHTGLVPSVPTPADPTAPPSPPLPGDPAPGTAGLIPSSAARVFDAAQLWVPPGAAATVDQQRYPAGVRPLARIWAQPPAGTPAPPPLEVKVGEEILRFRREGTPDQEVVLPDHPTATAIASRLEGAVTGLHASLIGPDTPPLEVPRPRSLSDPGDSVPFERAEALRTAFQRVPETESHALVLRQSPRLEQSTVAGRTPTASTPYPLLPTGANDSEAGTGVGDAADLATLLLVAAAPSFATVTVNDTRPALPTPAVGEVVQVFRRWNLDHRRMNEWRTLVTGHGAAAPPDESAHRRTAPTGFQAPGDAGRQLAEAMGWLPLWRAWLRIATSPTLNAGGTGTTGNPEVTMPGGTKKRPTNRELTQAVAWLLDMGLT